jgi:hypothetical protein
MTTPSNEQMERIGRMRQQVGYLSPLDAKIRYGAGLLATLGRKPPRVPDADFSRWKIFVETIRILFWRPRTITGQIKKAEKFYICLVALKRLQEKGR